MTDVSDIESKARAALKTWTPDDAPNPSWYDFRLLTEHYTLDSDDADFMAAASPAAVLELIERLEVVEAFADHIEKAARVCGCCHCLAYWEMQEADARVPREAPVKEKS